MKMRLHVLALCLIGLACRREDRALPTLEVWRHESGDPELSASLATLERFDDAHPELRLDVQTLPQGSYTEAITAAALAGRLPCVLDVDQPTVPNFAWTGHLRPLEPLLDAETLASLVPGAKSYYRGELFAVGQFDVVLALFARRSMLASLEARVASLDAPYTPEELGVILSRGKMESPSGYPLDLGMVHRGEWLTYAFSPWLQSAGADLVDRDRLVEAEGPLNGEEAVRVMTWFQSLFEAELVARTPVDDRAFSQGRALMHYAGSWVAPRYFAAFGDDLVIMPPPDFGRGPKVGSGSWQWGITRACPHPELAAKLLSFLISTEEIVALSEATGFVPVSEEAAARTRRYGAGGSWRIFFDLAKAMAVPRPESPGYPKISSAFEKAVLDIKNGAPAQEALDGAVDAIEGDAVRNRGYGFELSTETSP